MENRGGFGLTEKEKHDGGISYKRLKEIIAREETTIHRIVEDSNCYGAFTFITTSRPFGEERVCLTFFGLGFHTYRECWITDEWLCFSGLLTDELTMHSFPKEEILEQIEKRRVSLLGRPEPRS